MKPRLLKAGFFWRSDDSADIIVGESSVKDVVCIAPLFVTAVDLTSRKEVEIRLSKLDYIVAGLFGPSRPCGAGEYAPPTNTWNGSTHRYGVYSYETEAGEERIVILSNTPDGTRAAMLPTYATEAWKAVFYGMKPAQVWDICWSLKLVQDYYYVAVKQAMKEAADAQAEAEANALQHGASSETVGAQNLPGLHKKAALQNRGRGVEGSGSPAVKGKGHNPVPAPASI